MRSPRIPLPIVVHPCRREALGAAWERARLGLVHAGLEPSERATRGDGTDVERIARWLEAEGARIVVAAGGDGTVATTAQALLELPAERRPALGILPSGTADNLARSLGLGRLGDPRSGFDAVEAIAAGRTLRIDVGLAGTAPFLGSLALGMDARILALRNRLRSTLAGRGDGYALYLACCALSLLRHRPVRARLAIAGCRPEPVRLYDLLVLNAPLYAGEFRFSAAAALDDGALEAHLFSGAVEYVRDFTAAWGRHLRARARRPVRARRGERRTARLELEAETPLALQLDGEERGQVRRLEVALLPAGLEVVVPARLGPVAGGPGPAGRRAPLSAAST